MAYIDPKAIKRRSNRSNNVPDDLLMSLVNRRIGLLLQRWLRADVITMSDCTMPYPLSNLILLFIHDNSDRFYIHLYDDCEVEFETVWLV